MLFFDELVLEDLVNGVRNLLSAGNREYVLSEDLKGFIQDIEWQGVEESHLFMTVDNQFYK